MERRASFLLVVGACLLVIAAGAGQASAAWLRFEPGGAIRLASVGKIRFEAGVTVECNVILAGELEVALTPKVVGTVFGAINEMRWRECAGGEIERALRLPWLLTYQSIQGMLPNAVTAIGFALERFDIKFSTFGPFVRCRYGGNAMMQMAVAGANPYTSGAVRSLETVLGLIEGGGCPANMAMRGSFTLEPGQRIARL